MSERTSSSSSILAVVMDYTKQLALRRYNAMQKVIEMGGVDSEEPLYLQYSAKYIIRCIQHLRKTEKDSVVLASLDKLYQDLKTLQDSSMFTSSRQ